MAITLNRPDRWSLVLPHFSSKAMVHDQTTRYSGVSRQGRGLPTARPPNTHPGLCTPNRVYSTDGALRHVRGHNGSQVTAKMADAAGFAGRALGLYPPPPLCLSIDCTPFLILWFGARGHRHFLQVAHQPSSQPIASSPYPSHVTRLVYNLLPTTPGGDARRHFRIAITNK